jgi:hypothetical protein
MVHRKRVDNHIDLNVFLFRSVIGDLEVPRQARWDQTLPQAHEGNFLGPDSPLDHRSRLPDLQHSLADDICRGRPEDEDLLHAAPLSRDRRSVDRPAPTSGRDADNPLPRRDAPRAGPRLHFEGVRLRNQEGGRLLLGADTGWSLRRAAAASRGR